MRAGWSAPQILPVPGPSSRAFHGTADAASGSMTTYPVDIHVESPDRFDRVQLLVRLVLAAALGFVGVTAGWLGFALYLALPSLAAVAISSRGSQSYLEDLGPPLARVLGWLVGFHAYMALVIDRVPLGERKDGGFHMHVRVGGRPTTGAALARLVTSLPAALLLLVLIPVTALVAVVGVVAVLVARSQPKGLLRFQRAVVCFAGRLAAYHAALVEPYPPFDLESPPAAATPRLSA